MKKTISQMILATSLLSLACCKEIDLKNDTTKVVVSVQEENGQPASNVKVTVTHDYMQPETNVERTAITNNLGMATTSAKSKTGIWIRTQSPLYYPTFEDEIQNMAGPNDYTPKKLLEHNVIVRKIIKPIPLFAKTNDVPIPEKNIWVGFDLEKSDWIKPWGKGIDSDVEFWLENELLSVTLRDFNTVQDIEKHLSVEHINIHNKKEFFRVPANFYNRPLHVFTYDNTIPHYFGKWKGTVKMRTPYAKGGIIAEKEHFLAYNRSPNALYPREFAPEMRMPHHAPKSGYGAEYQWNKTSAERYAIDEKLGFFIKTRVKLDEQGNEISAHYAKFISDVEIDIRGRIKFTSYFNPTPNDTNLEFDLKKNLFKNLTDNEKPFLP